MSGAHLYMQVGLLNSGVVGFDSSWSMCSLSTARRQTDVQDGRPCFARLFRVENRSSRNDSKKSDGMYNGWRKGLVVCLANGT